MQITETFLVNLVIVYSTAMLSQCLIEFLGQMETPNQPLGCTEVFLGFLFVIFEHSDDSVMSG